ncbi:hypothetical protein [Actinomyces vulturis]|uniref:hypothetical protein n=1 Tax=Actinomyces vulturis TaxID=1857645 RepID=UPI000836C6F2|nr:hypothetical protein [Actinomyces vulturis]
MSSLTSSADFPQTPEVPANANEELAEQGVVPGKRGNLLGLRARLSDRTPRPTGGGCGCGGNCGCGSRKGA